MVQFLNILIYLHIAAGTVALISGPWAMSVYKGGNRHRLLGKIFFYAMMIVSASAIIVASSAQHRSVFLIIIGVFSAYMPLSGYRILHLKNLDKNQKPKIADWDISIYMACFTILMINYAGYEYFKGNYNEVVILIVFAIISVLLLRQDFYTFTKNIRRKNFWLYMHIGRMIGGNIAAFTAFLVVNNTILPPLVAWLLPTVVGTFVIAGFTRNYRARLQGDKEVSEVADVRIFPKVQGEQEVNSTPEIPMA